MLEPLVMEEEQCELASQDAQEEDDLVVEDRLNMDPSSHRNQVEGDLVALAMHIMNLDATSTSEVVLHHQPWCSKEHLQIFSSDSKASASVLVALELVQLVGKEEVVVVAHV